MDKLSTFFMMLLKRVQFSITNSEYLYLSGYLSGLLSGSRLPNQSFIFEIYIRYLAINRSLSSYLYLLLRAFPRRKQCSRGYEITAINRSIILISPNPFTIFFIDTYPPMQLIYILLAIITIFPLTFSMLALYMA